MNQNDDFEINLDDVAPPPGETTVTEVSERPVRMKRIIIDEADGMPNYEVVGVNGVVYQIRRGEEVEVPESVVAVLRNAVATRYVKVTRSDGVEDLQKRNLSSIPWRLVG